MIDANQVRINELARELEVKAKAIIDLLPGYGVTEKKTHSSWIPVDVAEKVRQKLTRPDDAEARSKARGPGFTEQRSVYISYAPQNHEWHNRIAAYFADAGFQILDHPPTPNPALVGSTREKAQVFVSLFSPDYFGSDESLKSELVHIRSLSQIRLRRPIAVIIAPCDWQSHVALHEFLV